MAGVDTPNQFPNSKMAGAVKAGQSRMVSSDVPDIAMGEQPNVSIAAATALTIPVVNNISPTYAVVTAVGGALYYTVDGTTPSSANYAGTVAQGSAVPFYGLGLLQALKFQGTQMSVAYYR